MSELDTFLEGLRAEGEAHSDGAFTVSLQVAEEKLQRFALVRPELYIVQLVGAAVASKASFCRITSGMSHLEILCDGLAPSKAELESLSSYLFYTVGAQEYLSELAVGAYGALSMPVKRVIIEAFNEDESWQLELLEKKQRLSPLKLVSPVLPLLRVVIDKGFGLRTRLTDRHPEQSELEVCRFAPLELTFDERAVSKVPTGPTSLYAWASLSSPEGAATSSLLTAEPATLAVAVPGLRGYIALANAEQAREQALYLVHNGVAVARQAGKWGPGNMCGVVHVEGLRKNISRSDLVENADYAQVTARLGELGWQLLAELCEDPNLTRAIWGQLQAPVSQALGRDDLPASSRAVLTNWQRLVSVSDIQGPGGHLRALQQARELVQQGNLDEARQLRLEILNKLSVRMLDWFERCQLDSMFSLVEPFRQVLQDMESSRYPLFLQAVDILNSLIYHTGPTEEAFRDCQDWGLHRRGLLLRYSGRPVEAAEAHAIAREVGRGPLAGWGYRFCGEIELARGDYALADELMAKAYEHLPTHRDLAEDRAFLKRLVSPDGRQESMRLLQGAVPNEDEDPFVQWLYLDWMVREGRAVLLWPIWVEMRARASVLELKTKFKHGKREQIEGGLSTAFDLLGWQSLEDARKRRCEAVSIAEKEFGPVHSYTQFSRRRAVYQLHRLEAHAMADDLQCRGHLLAQLQKCLQGL